MHCYASAEEAYYYVKSRKISSLSKINNKKDWHKVVIILCVTGYFIYLFATLKILKRDELFWKKEMSFILDIGKNIFVPAAAANIGWIIKTSINLCGAMQDCINP